MINKILNGSSAEGLRQLDEASKKPLLQVKKDFFY